MTERCRRVGAELTLQVHEPLRLMLQVAVSGMAPTRIEESLLVSCDGVPLDVTEVQVPGEGRVHLADPQPGTVTVAYSATIRGTASGVAVTEADRITYLRPSRYADSDRLAPIAQAEFAGISGSTDLLAGVSSWVGSQLRYVPGSSGPTDGAVDTLLKREGVCRDYAHLVIALLRALGVPARLAAVYAPGLDPMDFHAVAEAAVDDQWRAVDATLLAPRESLVRIATGRDAADTSFLSAYGGAADLLYTDVTAIVDGQLPSDDVTALVSIA
ncbi:MAG TPA: transglutaminase domain-containing protein [Jatrophihabitantaceae bacterium]|jgi:transglutaminase-like putative cysteine protease